MKRFLFSLLLIACSPSPRPETPVPSASASGSTVPVTSASVEPAASVPPAASSVPAALSGPPGVMMLDDDLLKRMAKKGEVYVVTLKKQANKKCTMTAIATIAGAPRKGDFEIACAMELKPGDYVVAIEQTGPSGKQIVSAGSVAPGQAEAAAKAHLERLKSLK